MKKIMFNDKYGLTKAVLEGRKTQTRRIVPQSVIDRYDEWRSDVECIAMPQGSTIESLKDWLSRKEIRYNVGEIVAVAQSYKAIFEEQCDDTLELLDLFYSSGWSNKMFVRADLMPYRIRIAGVRLECLQDISDEDCLKEGIEELSTCSTADGKAYTFNGANESYMTPREAFSHLINEVRKKGTWEANPYVFVYDFELTK